jgi:hypothetical protein
MTHQIAARKAAASAPSDPAPEDVFAFLMDYGTGKSGTILDEWGEMACSGGPQDLLVIAPAGSIRNWYEDKSDIQQSEINAQMDPAFVDRMEIAGWRSGGGKERLKRLERFMRVSDRPRALFVNVEALSGVEKAQELVREFVSQRLAYVAVDESTTIKSRKAQRTKFIRSVGEEAVVRRIATGLLTPKGPADIFAQFQFLDWRIVGCKSWHSFEWEYCVTRRMETGGRRFDVIVGYKNQDELADRIAPYSYRVLKSDCLDLEPKRYVMWDVEHTPEQRRLYRELRDNASVQLGTGEFVSTQHVMTLVMRLHQINLGFVVDEHGRTHEIPCNRPKELIEVLGLHRGKTIIWVPFHTPLKRIVAALEEEFGAGCTAQFHGANNSTRGEDERRFLGDPECRFMVSTQAAGGRGNTWNVADQTIYYGNTDDLEQRANSEDRNHRKGQTNRVTYVDMRTPGTVDDKIIKNLRKKITTATTMTREEAREWLI